MKNSTIALGYCVLSLLLNFFSRKVFLDYLGTEILGLNTTASNILQFLNISELGIGSAIGFTLFKPLADRDNQTIAEVLRIQGILYRRIAFLIIGLSAIVMSSFPWIFQKMELPMWYAYASFGVFLYSSLLSYFVNYRQVVLSASQQNYKILYSFKTTVIVKTIVQIFAIKYLSHPYVWWLILEAVFATLGALALDITVKRTFPELQKCKEAYKLLKGKYVELINKIKQTFFHKIAAFALSQSAPLIIYAYTTLTMAAIYGNYILIIQGVYSIMAAIFSGMGASVGNLIVTSEKSHAMEVFEELFSFRFWIISTICFTIFQTSAFFISFWIGNEYIMSSVTVFLMVLTLFVNLSRSTVDDYLYAFGLVRDIWAPITETILNIGCSIILGAYFGINGILIGVLISLFIIVIWKPIFLFSTEMKGYGGRYIRIYLIDIALLASIGYLMIKFNSFVDWNNFAPFTRFIFSASTNCFVFAILMYFGLKLTKMKIDASIKRICQRFTRSNPIRSITEE